MPKTTAKDPWHLRRCKNCKLTYKPTGKDRGNAERSKFCTEKCRKMYHNGGGMNMARLQEVVTRAAIKALLADDAFLEAIADKVRVIQHVPEVLRRNPVAMETLGLKTERYPAAHSELKQSV